MKKIYAAFLIVCSFNLSPSLSAAAEHRVDLRGIINVPGQQVGVALLQVDKETFGIEAGEHPQGWSKGKYFPIEVIDVDLTNEIVKTRIDGEEYTNSLPAPSRPAAAESWIHFQNADFRTALDVLAKLSNRTILLHPNLETAPFSCEATWTGQAPTKIEITACFAKALNQRETASLEDGDCFLQIVPASMTQTATLDAKAPPTSQTEAIQPGVIDFQNVEIGQVIKIYGKLLGRERKNRDPLPMATINFRTTRPLSKGQAIYAFETLFRWNGVKIILNDDNTFSVAKI